jgi:DNA-binding NtrC family response regulator
LRERIDDIEPLLRYFSSEFARKLNKPVPQIDRDVIISLKNYSFPGNVRELRNMIERALILCKGDVLTVNDFQTKVQAEPEFQKEKINFNLEENELYLIRLALKEKSYNQNKSAELLGITRDSLIRRMKKFNIHLSKSEKSKSGD